MIEKSIYTLAQANAGLQALLGSSTDMRLFPAAEEKEHALPRVVYRKVGQDPVSGIRQDSSWYHSDFQFRAYAATALEAKDLLDAVYACLGRYFSNNVAVSGSLIDDVRVVEGSRDEDFDRDLNQYWEEFELSFFHS